MSDAPNPLGPIATIAESASKSNARLVRIIIFLFIAVIIFAGTAIGVAEYIRWRLSKSQQNVRLNFTKEGATIIFDSNNNLHGAFSVPASARWINSGIPIPPKTTVQIKASGRINLAIHHVVDAAKEDTRPSFPWTGPEGRTYDNPRPKDVGRRNFLVDPSSNMGALIACLRHTSEPPPVIPQNPRPNRMKYVGEGTTITNTEDSQLELWFCVNDIFIDPRKLDESEKAYRTPDFAPGSEEYKKESTRWEYVKAHSYWDLWWDDNIGEFHVLVEQND